MLISNRIEYNILSRWCGRWYKLRPVTTGTSALSPNKTLYFPVPHKDESKLGPGIWDCLVGTISHVTLSDTVGFSFCIECDAVIPEI